jgi:NADH-quinone oxidoreductase subunit I
MTSEYDFSVFDVKDHNFAFANLTPEQADEKRALYEQFVAEKEAAKEAAKVMPVASEEKAANSEEKPATPKPAFKPAFKPSFKPKPKPDAE